MQWLYNIFFTSYFGHTDKIKSSLMRWCLCRMLDLSFEIRQTHGNNSDAENVGICLCISMGSMGAWCCFGILFVNVELSWVNILKTTILLPTWNSNLAVLYLNQQLSFLATSTKLKKKHFFLKYSMEIIYWE